jgi:hypothetical protein
MKVGNMKNLTDAIITYFQTMQPYDTIQVAKAKDPVRLVEATKKYIDQGNADIEFNNDYSIIKKLQIW